MILNQLGIFGWKEADENFVLVSNFIDGYASMSQDNQERLKARDFRALTILFGGRSDSPEFQALGDVVKLDEVAV